MDEYSQRDRLGIRFNGTCIVGALKTEEKPSNFEVPKCSFKRDRKLHHQAMGQVHLPLQLKLGLKQCQMFCQQKSKVKTLSYAVDSRQTLAKILEPKL